MFVLLIPFLPLLAFVINIFFGRRIKSASAYVTASAIGLSFVFSLIALLKVMKGAQFVNVTPWFTAGDLQFFLGYQIDELSSVMICVVTFVSFLIQIYSIGYMHGDKRYSRFFAFMGLFTFAMLGLVMANNFVEIFVCWELVGLCSYFLIGFWFEKPEAAKAGKKAFIVTKIGDTGFIIGIMLLASQLGTFDFVQIKDSVGMLDPNMLTIIAILIFCGAAGKSAQFPLHVWLPDAMEGPTPVSALIHAATMVAAGVYLVARTYFLFAPSEVALYVVAWVGCTTAFIAGSIAIANNDIKRILAYSTISQLGYMMLGIGLGGYTASMFHLYTHAFFKALLFLCAGSVIHAVHTQDIRIMGGLFSKMRITALTCVIGSLALAGIPPFAGFFSKDEILLTAWNSGNYAIFIIALLVSLLTAFYMFRMIFMVFFGKENPEIHPHESPWVMTVPLSLLSIMAIIAGFAGAPWWGNPFGNFLSQGHLHEEQINTLVMSLAIGCGVLGIVLAWLIYGTKTISVKKIKNAFSPVVVLLRNKYYFDEIYDAIIVKPSHNFMKIIDVVDRNVVDGAVNLVADLSKMGGGVLRLIQSGYVQTYFVVILFGLVCILAGFILGMI